MEKESDLRTQKKALRQKIQKKFVFEIITIFFIAICLAISLLWFQGTTIEKKLSEIKIREVVDERKLSFGKDLDSLHSCLEMLRLWGNSGLIDHFNSHEMVYLLGSALDAFPKVHSVKIVGSDGAFFVILRKQTAYEVIIKNEGDGAAIESQEWRVVKGGGWVIEKSRSEELKSHIGEKTPMWFENAISSPGTPAWSSAYIPYYGNEKVSTLSVAFNPQGYPDKTLVVGVDVLSRDILNQIESVRIGDSGITFLFDGQRNIFTSKAHTPVGGENFDIIDIYRSDKNQVNPATKAALEWLNSGKADDPVSFKFMGQDYWTILAPISQGRSDLLIGVVAKGAALFEFSKFKAKGFLLIFGSIILVSISLLFVIAYKYSHRIKDLSSAFISGDMGEDDVLDLISKGEGSHIEFKSTMRMNLNTGKHGKEIEAAWLKAVAAFLNSQGGVLLLGVNDEGIVSGLEADGFENGDKCLLHFKNLIQQHIGMEHMPYIGFELCRTMNKTVGIVTCEPALGPVFLRIKNEEAFYIRSGPSSVQLPISQALEYLKNKNLRANLSPA